MPGRNSLLLIAASTLSLAVIAAPAEARRLTLDDLAKVRDVDSPAIDPAGNWVAYTVKTVDPKADKNITHVWMSAWDGSRSVQLTNRPKESETTPRWSPDGGTLAFISSRDDILGPLEQCRRHRPVPSSARQEAGIIPSRTNLRRRGYSADASGKHPL